MPGVLIDSRQQASESNFVGDRGIYHHRLVGLLRLTSGQWGNT
jgi:hypothetical protein